MRGQTINRDKKCIEIPCNKTVKRHGKLYANWPLQEFCSWDCLGEFKSFEDSLGSKKKTGLAPNEEHYVLTSLAISAQALG